MDERLSAAFAAGTVERARSLIAAVSEPCKCGHPCNASFSERRSEILELLRELADEVEELRQEETCRLCGIAASQVGSGCNFISSQRCMANRLGLGIPREAPPSS